MDILGEKVSTECCLLCSLLWRLMGSIGGECLEVYRVPAQLSEGP